MSAHPPIESLVKETAELIAAAKADGKLDAGEIVQIGVSVSRKVAALGALAGSEKKALVMFVLKKGLDAAGGVPQLPGEPPASAEARAVLEAQILSGAGAAIDAVVAIASGQKMKPSQWPACFQACMGAATATAAVIAPKELAIVKEAVAALGGKAGAQALLELPELPVAAEKELVLREVAEPAPAIQESPTPAPLPQSPHAVMDTIPEVQPETEPSPAPVEKESPEKLQAADAPPQPAPQPALSVSFE